MKLMRIASGEHRLEDAPPGVEFDGRTRQLDIGDLPAGRWPMTLVGREGSAEIALPISIISTGEAPPAAPPKRRRRTAAPKAAKG